MIVTPFSPHRRIELLRELRFVPGHRDVPVVVVSSRSAQKHIDHALSLGAAQYLAKPFTPDGLAQAIDEHTQNTKPRPEVPS